jgi:Fic family protein
MPKRSPLENARRWWKERVDADRYVVSPAEAPSVAVARILRQEGLVLDVAAKRAWILTSEKPIDRRAIFIPNYWPVVALVLGRYTPAMVAGLSAIKLLLEDFSPPEELRAYQGINQSEYTLSLDPGFILRLRPHAVSAERFKFMDAPGGAKIPVQSSVDILTTLDEAEVMAGVESVSAWLRHLIVRAPELEGAADKNPRPVILQRLADIAGSLGNQSLGKQLDAAARRISTRTTSPSRTGVGTRIQIPQVLRESERGSGSPWLDEQAMRLARQESQIEEAIGTQSRRLESFPWRALRANAEQVKAYDAYHSTTMEGYRISRAASDAIVRGEPLPEGPQDIESLQAAMAVQGYSIAYSEVLEQARQKAPVDTNLILDLYEALFRPAVNAGITDVSALRGWRNTSVGLRGWRYVPPNPKKIPDLIGGFERFIAREDLNPLARALLTQLEFVTIHPFLDGNGRLGRLLMNHSLLSAGYPWVTVRSDERMPFFKSIERAQVDGDAVPFAQFLWHSIRQSVKEIERKQTPVGRKRQ